jgi:uncharacterized protein (DUF3084 family)
MPPLTVPMKALFIAVISTGIFASGAGMLIDQNILVLVATLVTSLTGLAGVFYGTRSSISKTISSFVDVVTKDNANLRDALNQAHESNLESDRQRQEHRAELQSARGEIAEATRINLQLSNEFAQVKQSLQDCLQFRQQLQAKE